MKTLSEKIEIMQAAKAGKPIEILLDGEWMRCLAPTFTWGQIDYRIKPEPRRVWVVWDSAGPDLVYLTQKEAALNGYAAQVIEFIEVNTTTP